MPQALEVRVWNNFLHDRPWISPWIKSLSNELDIIFLRDRITIWPLWRQQQSIVTSSAECKSMREDRRFYRHLRIGYVV